MRIFICLLSLAFLNAALAEDNAAPVEDKTILSEGEESEITIIKEPVFDQPITEDIGGRLDRVERTLDNKALLDMLELLESLKTDVSLLRGELEIQAHTVEQIKQKQRDLYTDIDNRLQNVESGKTTGTGQGSENTTVDIGDDEEPINPQKAEAIYQRAFKLLKESQYEQAHKAFKDFLKDFPDSPFSDNAQYWLGEANFVMQKYELAINEYQALLNTYPDSKKVSHALLKIGYSYAELGNADDAKKTLKEVKRQYPGSTAARLADERLRKISTAKESNT